MLVVQWRQRNLPKSVLHVQSFYFAYFLVFVVLVVTLSSLAALPGHARQLFICDDLARKTDYLMDTTRRNRRPQVPIHRGSHFIKSKVKIRISQLRYPYIVPQNWFHLFSQVPGREELRQYILPIALQSAMQSGKRCLVTGRTKSAARQTGQIHQGGVDDSVLNTSVGSLSESGYDGDMEDEGDLNADEMLDEELCSEFDDQGVLNKQSKDSSFLNWAESTRTSSTPSILYPNGSQNGFDFEVQEMETDPEPVLIDNEIHSANELCIPVALEADDTMDLEESCSKSRPSNVQRRQPLRAIENGNIPARAPISLKSQRRSSAWSRSTTH